MQFLVWIRHTLTNKGLRPFACWDCWFLSRRGHRCLSLVRVVCCQVDDSALGWSLVQRSSTECRVSECNREASIMRGPWPTRGCCAIGEGRNNKRSCVSVPTPLATKVLRLFSRQLQHVLARTCVVGTTVCLLKAVNGRAKNGYINSENT
jgi:hypothetical protein